MSFRCPVCSLTLNSSIQFQQHLVGKAHSKRLKKQAEEGSGPAAGRVKQINFIPEGNQAGQMPPLGTGAQSASSGSGGMGAAASQNGVEVNTYCQLCLLNLNSKEQARIHYSGTKHLRKLQLSRQHSNEGGESAGVGVVGVGGGGSGAKNGLFYCSFCSITVNSALQMDLHREGAKHKRMVEGIKRNASDNGSFGPAAKRPAMADPSHNIPLVTQQPGVIPLNQMYQGSS